MPDFPPDRLRVCLVSEEFPPETGWGGIGTYAYNLAHGLAALGHRVHVVARTWEKDHVEERDGFVLHRLCLPEPSWRKGTWWIHTHLAETREVLLWSGRVRRCVAAIARAEGLDIIESPEFRAQGLFASFAGRPAALVVKLHTPSYLCRQLDGAGAGSSRLDARASEHLELRLARRAALITSPSRRLADDVAAAWRLDPSAIVVVPNPIDVEPFMDTGEPGPEANTVLYVGRLERRKGVETLVRSLAVVNGLAPEACRLKLVGQDHGSGPGGISMQAHLRQLMAQEGIPDASVEFVGPVARQDLPRIYRSAAICVVPSLYENFPYTALEAMAAGCAVVASDVGGIPEMITHGRDGLLVPPGSPEHLGRAIARLLLDPGTARDLGAAARTTVRTRFDRLAIARLTASVYRSVAGSRQPAVAGAARTSGAD
jgi:glycogen(starch) synthase